MGRWILQQMPWPHATAYVEPFVGAGHIFLNRYQVSSEVINDADGRVMNFWRVCQKPRLAKHVQKPAEWHTVC